VTSRRLIPEQAIQTDVLIDGEPWQPPPTPPCRHVNIGFDGTVQRITADGTDSGELIGRRAVLRVMCLDCGNQMRWHPYTVETSDDLFKVGVFFGE
jgi:hypothetical protein